MKARVLAVLMVVGAGVVACSSAPDPNGTGVGTGTPSSSRKHGSDNGSSNGGSSNAAPEGDPTTPTTPTTPTPATSPNEGTRPDGGADSGVGSTTPTTPPKLQCNAIPTCTGATAMKSISGDGTESTSITGAGSQWLTIHIREDSLASTPIGFSAELYSPDGGTYELHMYEKDCTTELGTVTALTDGAEGIASWPDTSFLDDAKDVVLEVRHTDGVCSAAATWKLDILGGQF